MIKMLHEANIGFISAFCALLALGSITISSPEALAQSYPNKPIRFIIPMATGGSQDTAGRIIGQKFAERLGQPVLPENRGGAAGNVGFEIAAKARPDGYTIVMGASALAISPSLYKKLNYDPINDFAPISRVSQMPYLLLVRPSLPVNNLKELVAYAKANPGKLNYGSSGLGTSAQLATELFKSLANINVLHVPYKGAAQMLIGLIGGEIDILVVGPPAALSQIQAGKVKALAVLRNGSERIPLLPNVPTTSEAGIDNLDVSSWYGILAPAGTPRDIVNRLNSEWIKISTMPDTKEQLYNAGFEPLSDTPEQFAEFIKTETVRWAKVIKEAHIKSID